jgi:ABC-type branched-subunit amino acid transport system substrate-binding protein
MRIISSIIITLIALIGLVLAYRYLTMQQAATSVAPKTISIGWIGPLSGPAKLLGTENLNSLKLAIDEYLQKKTATAPAIQLFVADDQYKSELTAQEYSKMVKEHPLDILFVTTYSGLKNIASQATRDNVILIDSIDNDAVLASLSKNVFLIGKETEELAGIEASVLIEQNKKNVLILYNNSDEFMANLAQTLHQVLQVSKIKNELLGYKQENIDFKQILGNSKSHNYDAYVFFGYTEIGFAMKQARDLGIDSNFYSINVITDPVLQQNSQGATEGVYLAHFTAEDGNKTKALEFLKRYENKYHSKPTTEWTALQTYDAANIVLDVIQSLDPEHLNAEGIRNSLLKVNNFEGVSGKISIKPNGASRGIYPGLYILKNGVPLPIKKE